MPEMPAPDEYRALQAFESGSPETLASRVSSSPAAAAGALKRSRCSELPEAQAGARRHHRPVPPVDRGDDLLGVDPLQVDRGRAEVRVPELALDDVERHALAREVERVGVPELVRGKAPPDADRPREAAELDAHAGC